ncbi:MAG: hypothetical protein RLZZ129_614, partial [Verrucomicrobiota bacterium]
FHREGFVLIPGVFSQAECTALRQLTDQAVADPSFAEKRGDWFVVRNAQDYSIEFVKLFIREPIYSLVQGILGPECRYCGQNVIRNGPGQAVSMWHVDDCNKLEHPLPPEIPRWPAGARLPLIWLSVQVALSDILAVEDGPTEIVPGSHYSGRLVPGENPVFEGRPAEPILCRAGDIYLFNHIPGTAACPPSAQRPAISCSSNTRAATASPSAARSPSPRRRWTNSSSAPTPSSST